MSHDTYLLLLWVGCDMQQVTNQQQNPFNNYDVIIVPVVPALIGQNKPLHTLHKLGL